MVEVKEQPLMRVHRMEAGNPRTQRSRSQPPTYMPHHCLPQGQKEVEKQALVKWARKVKQKQKVFTQHSQGWGSQAVVIWSVWWGTFSEVLLGGRAFMGYQGQILTNSCTQSQNDVSTRWPLNSPFPLHFSYYSHSEYLSLAEEMPWCPHHWFH